MKRIWVLPVVGGLAALVVYLTSLSFGLRSTAFDYEIVNDRITISVEYNRALAAASTEDGTCEITGERKVTCVIAYTPGTSYRGEIHVEDVDGRQHTFGFKVEERSNG